MNVYIHTLTYIYICDIGCHPPKKDLQEYLLWFSLHKDENQAKWNYIVQRWIFRWQDLPSSTVDKNPPANAQDMSSNPGLEDHTCHGATKLVSHNCWSLRKSSPSSETREAARSSLRHATSTAPTHRNQGKTLHRNKDPEQPKMKLIN